MTNPNPSQNDNTINMKAQSLPILEEHGRSQMYRAVVVCKFSLPAFTLFVGCMNPKIALHQKEALKNPAKSVQTQAIAKEHLVNGKTDK